jgi:hypothetical protein
MTLAILYLTAYSQINITELIVIFSPKEYEVCKQQASFIF